jgi:precorrin-2/cobalt-factor-2 C20-methyltransferase
MKGTLCGVGLGPGDPELVTLKALKTLESVARIFVPAARSGQSLAGAIVRAHLPGAALTELDFPMTSDPRRLETAWREAAETIKAVLVKGDAAFAVLGDPLLYGSYIYLQRQLAAEGYSCTSVPGITAMSAAASRAGMPLAIGDERLLMLTGAVKVTEFRQYCRRFETLVLYKPPAELDALLEVFYETNPKGSGVLIEQCGYAGERVVELSHNRQPGGTGYFSVVILRTQKRSDADD